MPPQRAGRTGIPVLVLLTGLSISGCGGASPGAEPEPRPPTQSTAELEALYRARMDSARTRYTDADVRFMRDMIIHHAQALVMAGLAPERAASPSVRTLAARIINAQKDEIATMQQWLRDRGKPVPEVEPGGGLVGHGAHQPHHMPGMLTPERLRELDSARGKEFDRLFLRYMIQHHEGAVAMVRALFATEGAGQDEGVFRFATDAQVDQATEIDRMRRMLSELSGGEEPR